MSVRLAMSDGGNLRVVIISWQSAGNQKTTRRRPPARSGNQLAISWRSAGDQLAISWRSEGNQKAIRRQSGGNQQVATCA